MRKVICMLIVLLLCASMVLPAFAADDGFVPSITYKPDPEIIEIEDGEGHEHIGCVRDKDGNILSYVDDGCLIITPIAYVWDENIHVDEQIEQLLLFIYNSLNDGSMVIPYEKHEADLDPASMVVRDLFDARWACEEHPKMLEPEGVVLELTFDLGVVADAEIFVQTYDEKTVEWSPIVDVVNNGDGTVTCIFEHLCAIEFSMPVKAAATVPAAAPQDTNPNILPWIILLIVAVGAAVGVVVAKKKKAAV